MPSSVDPALEPFDTVLARGLARDLDERYQTAEEFAEAIEERADALGGLANQRAVAKLVREYAGEKIERDRELIRHSIAEIGSPSSDSEAPPAFPGSGAISGAAMGYGQLPAHAGAPPIAMPEPALAFESAPPRRWPLLLLGLLVIVAVGLGIGSLLMQKQSSEIKSSPLDSLPSATAPEPAHEPAPTGLPPVVEPARAPDGTGTQAAPAAVEAATAGSAAPTEVPAAQERVSAETSPATADAQRRERTRRESAERVRRSSATSVDKTSVDKTGGDKTSGDKSGRRPKPAAPTDILLNPYRTPN